MKILSWLRDPKGRYKEWRRKRDNRQAMQYQRGQKGKHWIDDLPFDL